MDLREPLILAVGDSSWVNVEGPGEATKIRSQAGYGILLADNRQDKFFKESGGMVNFMGFRSHLIRRVVRSTIAAETMAGLESVEEAELFRAHLTELREELDIHGNYEAQLRKTKVLHLADCKSLYDLIHHRGTIPSERRLLLDIEALREMQLENVESLWISADDG